MLGSRPAEAVKLNAQTLNPMLQAATQASPVSRSSEYGDEAFEARMLGHWHRCYITRSLLYSFSLSCPAIFAGDTEGTSFTQTHLHSHSHSHRTKTTAMAMATRDGNDISSINFNVCLASALSLTPAAAGDDYFFSSTVSAVSAHDIPSVLRCCAWAGAGFGGVGRQATQPRRRPGTFWLDTPSPTGSILFVNKAFSYLS